MSDPDIYRRLAALEKWQDTMAAVEWFANGTALLVPRSGGSATFALDASSVGSSITIANLSAAQPFGAANNFGGLILIQETAADGGAALFLTGAGFMTLIADTAGIYSNAQGTLNRINVYLDASTIVTIENRRGGSRTVNVVGIRIRASN